MEHSSCFQLAWQKGGVAVCFTTEEDRAKKRWADVLTEVNNQVYCYNAQDLLLNLGCICQVVVVDQQMLEWSKDFCVPRMTTRNQEKEEKDKLTSGIKSKASVFNVWGQPYLCVESSGSMKRSNRGHFRHLLCSGTTQLPICVPRCPSVPSNILCYTQLGLGDTLSNECANDGV